MVFEKEVEIIDLMSATHDNTVQRLKKPGQKVCIKYTEFLYLLLCYDFTYSSLTLKKLREAQAYDDYSTCVRGVVITVVR